MVTPDDIKITSWLCSEQPRSWIRLGLTIVSALNVSSFDIIMTLELKFEEPVQNS